MAISITLVNPRDVAASLEKIGWMGSVSSASANDLKAIGRTCLESGHFTPSRPVLFEFEIKGVSRVFSHQFVREEVGVYKVQESQKYVKMTEANYVIPPTIKPDTYAAAAYTKLMNLCWETYHELIASGVTADDARFAIPGAAITKLHVAISLEAMIRIANKRLCRRASWEIREVVAEMVRLICDVEPYYSKFLVPNCEKLLYCPEKKGCGLKPSKNQLEEIMWIHNDLRDS